MTAITTWPSYREPRGQRHATTLSAVFARFRTPRALADKMSAPGWAPATFKNDYRSLESHECSYAVGLDIEGDGTDFETTCALWAEFWCFVHSTFSSTPEVQRLRAIFPTSRPIVRDDYARVQLWLRRQSEAAGQPVDRAASDASRLWFTPSVAPGAEYLCRESTGAILDVDAVLDAQPAEEEQATRPAPVIRIGATTTAVDRARRYLDRCPPAVSGAGGHVATFIVAAKIVRGFALDEATAFALLTEWNATCQPPWSEREFLRKVREAARSRYPEGQLLNARRRCG